MTIQEAVTYLKTRGIDVSYQNVRDADQSYNLRCSKSLPYKVVLDNKRVAEWANVLQSPLRVDNIVKDMNVPYSKVYYFINKHRIITVKKFGRLLIKSKKDGDYVRKNFENL